MSKMVNGLHVIDNRFEVSDNPIIFLHSLGGSSDQWQAQLDYFGKNHRVIAIDLPGHGQSERQIGEGESICQIADMVLEAVDQLGIDRFVLVGHSFGGSVAVAMAGKNPARVGSLMLVDSSGDASQIPAEAIQPFLEGLASPAYTQVVEAYWEENLAGSKEGTKEVVLGTLRLTPAQTVINGMKGLLAFDPVDQLNRYRGPKYALITQHNETPMSLQNLIDMPFDKIEDCGHWLQIDQPESVNRYLAEAIYSIEGRANLA